jgi:hypothetical protein
MLTLRTGGITCPDTSGEVGGSMKAPPEDLRGGYMGPGRGFCNEGTRWPPGAT